MREPHIKYIYTQTFVFGHANNSFCSGRQAILHLHLHRTWTVILTTTFVVQLLGLVAADTMMMILIMELMLMQIKFEYDRDLRHTSLQVWKLET